ncbi:MAG: hypothetical protein J5819_00210 [Eubacterium sp.]|nr:hypothetical protein [Eubacterium sp.]
MSFKTNLPKITQRVMLNMNYFADIHNVNGKEIKAVVDEVSAEERSLKTTDRIISDSVFNKYTKVYVAKEDYGKRPMAGKAIFHLDGKNYRVQEVDDEGEMYVIYLEVASSK